MRFTLGQHLRGPPRAALSQPGPGDGRRHSGGTIDYSNGLAVLADGRRGRRPSRRCSPWPPRSAPSRWMR